MKYLVSLWCDAMELLLQAVMLFILGMFYADPGVVDVTFRFAKMWRPSGQFSRRPEQMSTTRGAVPSIVVGCCF